MSEYGKCFNCGYQSSYHIPSKTCTVCGKDNLRTAVHRAKEFLGSHVCCGCIYVANSYHMKPHELDELDSDIAKLDTLEEWLREND